MSSPGTEAVVRSYFTVVSDLTSDVDDLAALLADDFHAIEHPNPISPAGSVRDRDATLAGFASGKRLLSEQTIAVHEVLVVGERAAVRSTWRGTVAADVPGLAAGAVLEAEMGGFVTVVDGLVTGHETFDCYRSLPRADPQGSIVHLTRQHRSRL